MREAALLHPASLKACERGGGARTIPLVSRRLESTSFVNGITGFGPSAQIPWHFHDSEKSVMLLEGNAVFDIGDEHHDLVVHDTTFMPAGVSHRFRDASDNQGMKILWVHGRVDADRALVENGETRSMPAEHMQDFGGRR